MGYIKKIARMRNQNERVYLPQWGRIFVSQRTLIPRPGRGGPLAVGRVDKTKAPFGAFVGISNKTINLIRWILRHHMFPIHRCRYNIGYVHRLRPSIFEQLRF